MTTQDTDESNSPTPAEEFDRVAQEALKLALMSAVQSQQAAQVFDQVMTGRAVIELLPAQVAQNLTADAPQQAGSQQAAGRDPQPSQDSPTLTSPWTASVPNDISPVFMLPPAQPLVAAPGSATATADHLARDFVGQIFALSVQGAATRLSNMRSIVTAAQAAALIQMSASLDVDSTAKQLQLLQGLVQSVENDFAKMTKQAAVLLKWIPENTAATAAPNITPNQSQGLFAADSRDATSTALLSGTVQAALHGATGFDIDCVLSNAEATDLVNKGFHFCLRYIARTQSAGDGNLTAEEATGILAAGLALMPVQHVAEANWSPSEWLGRQYGSHAAQHAKAIGFPQGVNIWCDLEGIAEQVQPADVIAYCNSWAESVCDAHYVPGLYVGSDCNLNGQQLYDLAFKHYWQSMSQVPTLPQRGYQMVQHRPETVCGCSIDRNTIQTDREGGLPIWLAPVSAEA
jgi:hypothetical protein